jgi:hypothetical protein
MTSSTQTSSDLVARYIQAVGFWLPSAQKEDIVAELSEDLRSQIEDREEQRGRPLNDEEIADLLRQRGRPILVAGQFVPQRSLIGPALYPIYVFVLKIAALFYVIPWLLIWIGILLYHRAGPSFDLGKELSGLGTLGISLFTQFSIITVIFAAIERLSSKTARLADWDPKKLPKIKVEAPTKRRYSAVCGIVGGVFGLLWLLAIPEHPFLIIGPAAFVLKGAPIWQTVYWPLVALSLAAIFEHVVRLLRPHLTWFPPAFRLATTLLSAWVVNALLHTQTYVLPRDVKAAEVAGIFNVCILISVAIWGVCLVVGVVVYGWRAFRDIRRSMQHATPHPA